MDIGSFNIADVGVLLVILLSGLLALVRGFVREVLSVAAWVGAALATLYAFPYAQPFVREFIEIPWLADGAAGIAVFVVTLIVLSIVSHAISSRVNHSAFDALDKSLGLLFGLLRGAIVVCLIYLLIDWALPRDQHPKWLQEARSTPFVQEGARLIESIIPGRLRRRGADAASAAGRTAREAMEVDRTVRRLSSPPPKDDAPKPVPGYNAEERKEMDRLIQGTQ